MVAELDCSCEEEVECVVPNEVADFGGCERGGEMREGGHVCQVRFRLCGSEVMFYGLID